MNLFPHCLSDKDWNYNGDYMYTAIFTAEYAVRAEILLRRKPKPQGSKHTVKIARIASSKALNHNQL